MIQHRAAHTLSGGDYGWLKDRHHFRVTQEGDPAHGPLGALVVWNDDEVAPGTGFGLHPHADMEIITFVREGTVTHRDSTGGVGHIQAGDVQVMSAGTGIRHAERNEGDVPLRNLPDLAAASRARRAAALGEPSVPERGPRGPAGGAGQGASWRRGGPQHTGRRAGARGDAAEEARLPSTGSNPDARPTSRRQGALSVNGCRLVPGDGLAAVAKSRLEIQAEEDAEIVLVDAA